MDGYGIILITLAISINKGDLLWLTGTEPGTQYASHWTSPATFKKPPKRGAQSSL